MIFANKLKDLREKSELPQRKIAAALDIDTATYCRIEKGVRVPTLEQTFELAKLFGIAAEEFKVYWLADQVARIIGREREGANKVFDVVKKYLDKQK